MAGHGRVVRTSESVCPQCFARIPSRLVEDGGSVFMEKTCPEHGAFRVPVSPHSWYFEGLRPYYDALVARGRPCGAKACSIYTLFLTMRCNLNCPICFTDAHQEYQEPDLAFIEEALSGMRGVQINLFGGEPTVREDLPDVVRLVRRTGNLPLLFTNGLRLADVAYLRSLKEAGLDEVHLQFDGFEEGAYRAFRSRPLLEMKLAALGNLEALDVPTVLETTIARGVNEDQLGRILDYAVRNDFVRAVAFRSYSVLGKAGLGPESCLTLEDLIDLLELQTDGRIALKDVFHFQRLMYAFFRVLGLNTCFYNHYYLLYRRSGGGYDTAGELLDIDGLEYDPMLLRAHPLASVARLAPRLVSRRSAVLLLDALSTLAAQLGSGQRFYYSQRRRSRRMLVLGFEKACDRYTFDFEHVHNCPGGEITTDDGVTGSFSLGNIKRDERAVLGGRSRPERAGGASRPRGRAARERRAGA